VLEGHDGLDEADEAFAGAPGGDAAGCASVRSTRIARPTDAPEDPARYWSTRGFELVAEPLLRRLLSYWQSKRATGRLPDRRDIDPLDIPWALDRIYLIDRVPAPAFWRYRLAGARIEETFGVNSLRGLALPDFMAASHARLLAQRWQPLIDRGCAIYMSGTIYRTTERLPVGGRLLLPLSDGEPAQAVGLVGITEDEWRRPEAGRPDPGLDIHYIDPDGAGAAAAG
jgi:hypothetical protein